MDSTFAFSRWDTLYSMSTTFLTEFVEELLVAFQVERDYAIALGMEGIESADSGEELRIRVEQVFRKQLAIVAAFG